MLKNENFDWGKEVNDYTAKKKQVYENFHPVQKVTHKSIKHLEAFYNPITQKYNDPSIQIRNKQIEKETLPVKISKYYDKSLRYEQTFDIINLKDKLKVFEGHPDYPQQKIEVGANKKNLETSRVDYNILSNKHLQEHHFDKPENRPYKSTNNKSQNPYKKVWNNKDYDIISNKYLVDDSQKKSTNEVIFNIESANKYWKTHNFDPIVGAYYSKEKENKYQNDMKEKSLIHGKDKALKLPKSVLEKGLLYNPVNQQVLDRERLSAYEQKEKNKIQRYSKRFQIEDYYNVKNSTLDETKKKYFACENPNENYDIINLKKFGDVERHENKDWQRIVNSAGVNSTFGKKSIYKDPYDFTDHPDEYKSFISNRNSKYISIFSR